MMEDSKPVIDGCSYDNSMLLDTPDPIPVETDTLTMYSDAASILYGTDPHYILSEAQACFD